MKLKPYPTPYIKINSKCIEDTNVRDATIKLLYVNRDKTLQIWVQQWFLRYDIKSTSNKIKNTPCSWIGRINIVKMTILPKAIQIQCNPYQTTNDIFQRTITKILKVVWRCKRPQIAKSFLRKKNGAGGIRLPYFRLCYKATVIKTVWYWHKNRNKNQQNRIESPEINSCTYGQLIYDKGGQTIPQR